MPSELIERALPFHISSEETLDYDEDTGIDKQIYHMKKIVNAFIQTNLSGAVTYWSKEAQQLFGWSHGDTLGRDFFTMILTTPMKLSQLLGEGTQTFELTGTHRDGHEIELELNLFSELWLSNNKTDVTLFLRDLSAQRQQALRLSQSEERNRQIFENALDAVIVANIQGTVVAWNRHAETTFGWTINEAVGRNLTDVVIPLRFHAQHLEGMKRFLQTGEKRIIDKRLEIVGQHRQGHEFPVELTISTAMVSEELLFTAFLRDISERQKMLEQVRQSEERIRQIVENALDAVVTADENGFLTYWNNRAEKMFGWSRSEAIGQNLADLIIPPRYRNAHRQGLQHFLHTGIGPILNQQIEHIGLRRDGSEFPMELSISPLKLDKSYIFTGFVRDITSRKAAEQQIRQAQINSAITQNEIKIAQQIQASLLPPTSIKTINFEVTGYCLPADKVGGDYFDYFFRSEDILDMVIADVSGHSIGPALFMVETRSAIRAMENRTGTPSEILSILNNFLYHDLNNSDFFISLFYLQYDISNQQLRFANAGHPPPLLLSPCQNQCIQLDTEGMILGVQENVFFEEKSRIIAKGDIILFYTDGLTESDNGYGEFFGMERVSEIVIANSQQTPQNIIDALLKQLKQFCQTEKFNDDITLMIFKRN